MAASAPGDPGVVRDLLLRAAALMMAGGYAVPIIGNRLQKLATSYGFPQARTVILPTLTLVSIPGRESARVEVETVGDLALRLDQTAELGRVLSLAERGKIPADEALRVLDAVTTMKPRRGPSTRLAGYVLLTIGVGLMLRPTLFELAAIAVLGAMVGVLVGIPTRRLGIEYLMPVLAATVVAAAASLVAEVHGEANAARMLIPPLVTFLPGALITMAVIDLTSNEVISGSSRLVLGGLKLLLLALGIIAGAELASVGTDVFHQSGGENLGAWAAWVGVIVFGYGVYLHFSAPAGSLRWLLVVLGAAWLGQLIGERIFGTYLSGFIGSLVMTPTAMLVERQPSAPPSHVLFLPAFWMLVPGALGLLGVTELVRNPGNTVQVQGAILSFVGIALGVYVGGALFLAATTAEQVYERTLSRSPWSH